LPSLHGFFLRKKENDRYEERDDTNLGKKREAEVRIVLMRPFRSVGEAFYSTTAAKAEVCV
jgi:hypothetical protein